MLYMGKETETKSASPPPVDSRAIEETAGTGGRELCERLGMRRGGVPGEIRTSAPP